jgi:hypothetical protein
MEVQMFKAIAGVIAVAAIVGLGFWAVPPLRRELQIRRM